MAKVSIITKRVHSRFVDKNYISLNEDDFNPTSSFFEDHPNIVPESIEVIYTEGILEDFQYIRCLIKNIDWMLKVNGIFKVRLFFTSIMGKGYYIRTKDAVMYEISSVFKERIQLVDIVYNEKKNVVDLSFRKKSSSLNTFDNINSWTFGIVSDGRKNDRIMSIINRIFSFGIPNFEVIICGPAPSDKLPMNVKILDDTDLYDDKRIPISRKKNRIIKNAKFDNLVIIHDRIMLSENWFLQIKNNGNYFDAIIPAILDETNHNLHVNDGTSIPTYETHNKYTLPTYGVSWNQDLFIDGGIIIIKRQVATTIPIAPYLNWGEREDVQFSRNLYINGFYTYINHNIQVDTLTYQQKGMPLSNLRFNIPIYKLLSIIRSYCCFVKNVSSDKKLFYTYLQSQSGFKKSDRV